jgi:large subunit ribosomal protein L23
VSEKATMIAEKTNTVTFKVLQDATKPRSKLLLMFKVDVKAIAVVNTKGNPSVSENPWAVGTTSARPM